MDDIIFIVLNYSEVLILFDILFNFLNYNFLSSISAISCSFYVKFFYNIIFWF